MMMIKLFKDHDCIMVYHSCKEIVITNALRRKMISSLAYMQIVQLRLVVELRELRVDLSMLSLRVLLASFKYDRYLLVIKLSLKTPSQVKIEVELIKFQK